ncbi:hypothetical protein [Bauldia litoralis]|uniref:hypothetical protein n=1 Tax=Bauldia litoralis TaxID=665467 RepID=UPI0032639792
MSTSLTTGTAKSNAGGWRLPAGNLERLVLDRLRTLLADQSELLDTVREYGLNGIAAQQLIESAGRIAEELTDRSPGEIRLLLINLIRRVELRSETVKIEIFRQRLASVLQAPDGERPDLGATGVSSSEDIATLTIAARLQRSGREMRMVVQNANDQRSRIQHSFVSSPALMTSRHG